MKPFAIGRRGFLRGLGGVTLALPYLESQARAAASALPRAYFGADGFPKRFVVMFSPNGTIRNAWLPQGTETEFTLSKILAPLERHKASLVVVDGVSSEAARHAGNNGHDRGMGTMLTATEIVPGPSGKGEFGHFFDGSAGGPSIDQVVAKYIGVETKFRSVELGVQANLMRMAIPSRMSYLDKFKPMHPVNDPVAAFNRLFAGEGIGLDPAVAAALRRRQITVVDAVIEEYRATARKLGAEDRARLDAHLTNIRELERRIKAQPAAPAQGSCKAPTVMATRDGRAIGRMQMDIIASALACGVTRVASLQWTTAQGGSSFFGLGSHHALSHEGPSNTAAEESLVSINVAYAEQFALLLDRLKAVREGNGTLLDNTLVVWINELGDGRTHSTANLPIVLAGGAGGSLRQGRFLRYTGRTNNDLFVSFLQAFGIDQKTFGNPRFLKGPLPGLA